MKNGLHAGVCREKKGGKKRGSRNGGHREERSLGRDKFLNGSKL